MLKNEMIPAVAFVLNLDKRPSRWECTRDRLREALPFVRSGECQLIRFSAVNGYDLGRDVAIKGYGDDEIWTVIQSAASTTHIACGVLGCLLSHYFLLKHISSMETVADEDWILVFEDDVHTVPESGEQVSTFFRNYCQACMDGVVFLGGRFEPHFKPSHESLFTCVGDDTPLYRRPGWRQGFLHHADYDRTTHAYTIQKRTSILIAKWIVEWIRTTRTVQSIDTFVYGMIEGVPTYDWFPHPFYSPLHYESDIQDIPIERFM